MRLTQARPLIEQGRVVKVSYYLHSPNYRHDVLLQRQGKYLYYQLSIYLMQHGEEQWLHSRTSSRDVDWAEVIRVMDGAATHSSAWEIVDAQLDPFPERAEEQQTPPHLLP